MIERILAIMGNLGSKKLIGLVAVEWLIAEVEVSPEQTMWKVLGMAIAAAGYFLGQGYADGQSAKYAPGDAK